MTSIRVPDEIDKKIRGGMSGGKIELPWPVIYLAWWNGKNGASQNNSGVQFFGGWYADAGRVDEQFDTLPKGFVLEEFFPKGGGSFYAYAKRSVGVAPISYRFRWVEKEGGGGGYGHKQTLAYLAELVDGAYKPWGPVVLTAVGHASMRIDDALSKFEKETAKARTEFAGGAAPYFFYTALGTFGDRDEVMVGKTQQSPITPCHVMLPKEGKEITEDTLKKWYVGDDIAVKMALLMDEAGDWLEAWETEEGAQGQPPPPDAWREGEETQYNQDASQLRQVSEEDEIPF